MSAEKSYSKFGNSMSRVGKQLITIPKGTTVTVAGSKVTVKGALGELQKELPHDLTVTVNGETATIAVKDEHAQKAVWGTAAAHLKNMINGVNTAFQKKLILEGIGYKVDVQGDQLNLALGFSHPVKVKIPAGLKAAAEKGVLTISGPDREAVGQFAADIRSLKKPEPYKGKGFRYEGEVIRRKEGKKTVT